ncbi:carboxylating nicotinate-nucleotide diphosphorylase [bacterium]|nr:carboxylating nicotinate-nucleotide diphosphorylase [bacterium]
MNNYIIDQIKDALFEDIHTGDITTDNCIDKDAVGSGDIIVKEECTICGTEIFKQVFHILDDEVNVIFSVKDGDIIKKDTVIGSIKGPLAPILKGERVGLNYLQRMSGISTLTNKYVSRIQKSASGIIITDTRKTTPNFRYFEKYAVKTGGGRNHRSGLYDAVMIKDNHIAAAGGISNAVQKIKASLGHAVKLEVEVKSLAQAKGIVDKALPVDIVMLDNFSPQMIRDAIAILSETKVIVEVSGGISLDTLDNYILDGVDVISVGKLTHSAKSIDISLDIKVK